MARKAWQFGKQRKGPTQTGCGVLPLLVLGILCGKWDECRAGGRGKLRLILSAAKGWRRGAPRLARSITPTAGTNTVLMFHAANPSERRRIILKITGKSGRAPGNLARAMLLPQQNPAKCSTKDNGSVVGPGCRALG